jgi:competence protein ComGC
MKFHRVSIKAVRLMKNMGKLKGFLLGSVLKVLIFPKVLILLRLPCLITFLERLIGSGAWGAVHGVLN